MKTSLINLTGTILLTAIVATIIYLFFFAGNGHYVAHFNIAFIFLAIKWNDGTLGY